MSSSIISHRLAIVVPCYNEEAVLPQTSKILLDVLQRLQRSNTITDDSFICFVDDGSTDTTWSIICQLHQSNPQFIGVKLSRNFGHQSALLAGLFSLQADMYVTIDADLQDDAEAILEMVKLCQQGKDVVYGVRTNRDSDSWFKRQTALTFYRLFSCFGGKCVPNHADFRLLSRRAVETLTTFPEHNLFLRGMVPMLGYPTAQVCYERRARTLGISKYPFRRMLAFAWEGLTSFSVLPLHFITLIGMILLGCGGISLLIYLSNYFLPIPLGQNFGWVVLLLNLFGLQIFFLGIVAEYVGKMYMEVKQRPRFIIQEKLE